MPAPAIALRVALALSFAAAMPGVSVARQVPPDQLPPGQPAAGAESAEPGSAETFLARLDAARRALSAQGVVDPLPQEGPLQIAFERTNLPYTRDVRGQQIRTLAGVVRLLNTGEEPVHVGPGTLLLAGAERLEPNVTPENLRFSNITDVRGNADDWRTYRTIEPGAVAELPASFVGLPGGPNGLPASLALTVPHVVGGSLPQDEQDEDGADVEPATEVNGGEPRTTTFDVFAYHAGLADLAERRTGPKRALAVIAVRGELTYVGRFAAVARLRRLANAGARRGVLLWENVQRAGDAGEAWEPIVPPLPDAAPSADGTQPFNPAKYARFIDRYNRSAGTPPQQAGFMEFAQAPGLPEPSDEPAEPAPSGASLVDANSRRAALLKAGMSAGSSGPAADLGPFQQTATEAVSVALRSALRTLDAQDAETLIRSAEPLVQPAAVRHA
ncbi:MAG: hypothetical protein AAF907_10940, partial [Planctomycetota bacterium]